jgi:HEAT repeat protein
VRRASAPPRRATAAGFPAPASAAAAEVTGATAADPRAGLLQREVAANARAARRRRGPVTMDVGKKEADEATDRDALLDLFFDFSRQYFDYAALFLVHGDIAEGREAFGAGAPRERVLGIGVPLDLPSTISSVRDKKATTVVKVPADGLDGVLLGDLGRARDVEVAFVPLIVRTRAVAILIGDCGPVGIDRASMAQVTAFAVHVGKSFERIIVRRKLDGFIAGGPKGGTAGKVEAAVVSQKRPVVPTASAPPPAPAANATLAQPAPRATQEYVSAQPGKASVAPAAAAAPARQQSIRPGPNTAPPPPANIAVLRKIGGPPIPREEPEEEAAARTGIAVAAVAIQPSPVVDVAAVSQTLEAGPEIQATVQEASGDVFDELAWEPDAPPAPEPGDEVLVPEPPPSSSVAVPPHLPPSSQQETTPLPKVIVDMDEDLASLLSKVVSGSDEQAEGELLRQGDKAMAVLMHAFPGPVNVDRARFATMGRPPRASDCGPVLRLVAHERKVALPSVLERLNDADPERRGWAVHLLCELAYPEAIPHLLLRLRDTDAATRASAAMALAAVARGWPREVRDAVLALAHAVDPRERAAAMGAMGDLKQPALVPELVRALADGDAPVVAAAHKALVGLTRQDFGAEDARPWLKWWEQHQAGHRIEWLIDSLTHEVTEIRKAAGEELRLLTKEYFGYASDLPPRDRERAKQRYRDWWVTEGKSRFARRREG